MALSHGSIPPQDPQFELILMEQPLPDNNLNAQIFQRLHPRAYLEKFLANDLRPDGRELGDWRDVSVNTGSISTASGSSLVKLGQTILVTGVKLELCEPSLDRPDEGFIVPNIDLPPLCHPKFKSGPPSEEAQVLSERVYDVLVSGQGGGLLDLKQLCIHPGKSAWVLFVDVTCLNYDGNIFDAFLLGALTALSDTKVPQTTYDEDTGQTICSGTESVSLRTWFNQPATDKVGISSIGMSFGIFGTRILADPTAFEEPLLDATVSVVMALDQPHSLLSVEVFGMLPHLVEGNGGQGPTRDILGECVGLARQHVVLLASYFRKLGF